MPSSSLAGTNCFLLYPGHAHELFGREWQPHPPAKSTEALQVPIR